jgi:hypothetical protein
MTETSSILSLSVVRDAATTRDDTTDTRPAKQASIEANADPRLNDTATKEVGVARGGWSKLPTEIKLMILRFRLELSRPIHYRAHCIHVLRVLQGLCAVSKETCELALEVYNANNFILERSAAMRLCHDGPSFALFYPKARVGAFVKAIDLHLRVDDSFKYDSYRPAAVYDPRGNEIWVNQWSYLLRPCGGQGVNTRWTNWQISLPNLVTLNLIMDIRTTVDDGRIKNLQNLLYAARCLQAPPEDVTSPRAIKDVFEDTEIIMNPRHLTIMVTGFSCDGILDGRESRGAICKYGCSLRVAKAIHGVFEQRRAMDTSAG